MLLRAQAISFHYGRREILREVSFDLGEGEWLAVIGPNGAGKTTMMRILLGLLSPSGGDVVVSGKSLKTMKRREICQKIALLPQQAEIPFGFTVREIVAMGRTPYLGRFLPLTPEDHEQITSALEITELMAIADRPVRELSGGETQRVYLARAFAQNTPVLVLDEPTTNLDLYHEKKLLDQVQQRKDQGKAVVSVLHDLNLAARYADQVLLLTPHLQAYLGSPEEILTPDRIESTFQVRPIQVKDPQTQQIRLFT